MNTKKLYQSDGYAVKELLKVTAMLYSAMKSNNQDGAADETEDTPLSFDITSRVSGIIDYFLWIGYLLNSGI